MRTYTKSYNKVPKSGNFGDNNHVTKGKGNKIVFGSKRKTPLSDMENRSTNKWDSMVDRWIEDKE